MIRTNSYSVGGAVAIVRMKGRWIWENGDRKRRAVRRAAMTVLTDAFIIAAEQDKVCMYEMR